MKNVPFYIILIAGLCCNDNWAFSFMETRGNVKRSMISFRKCSNSSIFREKSSNGGQALYETAESNTSNQETLKTPDYEFMINKVMRVMNDRLDMIEYPIADELCTNCASIGKGRNQREVSMHVSAYSSEKFRLIRTLHLKTSGPIQILNFVMFPSTKFDLPIFGVDLISLPGSHLICIDLQPPADTDVHRQPLRHMAGLEEGIERRRESLPWAGELPEDAKKFFSSVCVWSRVSDSKVVDGAGLDAFLEFLVYYLSISESAEPILDSSLLEGLEEGHLSYNRYRRINDPGRGMLINFFGAEIAERVISEVLFNYELEQKKG